MSICFIVTGLGMGGAERQVCDLADQFILLNQKVLIISLTGETVVKPKSKNIQLIELKMNKNFFGLIKALKKSALILNQFDPDVIHSHMVHANLFARLLRVSMKVSCLICTAHNTNEGGKARILAYRLTNNLANLNTNVSNEAVEAFIKSGAVSKNKMIAVQNGIDVKRFHYSHQNRLKKRKEINIADDIILLLAVGRMQTQKDYPNMLQAFASVVKESSTVGKSVLLGIIGQGELEAELKALANELGIDNQVRFLGLQCDVEKWLSAADFYLMSSAWEGLPLVIAEAMAEERFIIATNCGGVSELVGDTGILVPPKNSQALASAMLEAINIPADIKQKMVTQARQRIIDNYSLDAVAKKWLTIYNDTAA